MKTTGCELHSNTLHYCSGCETWYCMGHLLEHEHYVDNGEEVTLSVGNTLKRAEYAPGGALE